MKKWIVLLSIVASAGCDRAPASQTIQANERATGEVTICSCALNIPTTSAKADACAALIDSMPLEEYSRAAMACRDSMPVPEDGPDLCYCMKASPTDPELAAMCEKIVPENMSPREIGKKLYECSR